MSGENEAEAIRRAICDIIKRFDVDSVAEVEKGLTAGDKISLFYLLNDDPGETLDLLKSRLDRPIVTQWCRKVGDHGEWKLRMIESLLVMQNYRTLQMLKYDKIDLSDVKTILDMGVRSPDFDIRKELYRTFDNLTVDELHSFIAAVENEKSDIAPEYIEMYLLKWQIKGYFTFENVCSLNFLLNILDRLNFCSSHSILKQFVDNFKRTDFNETDDIQISDPLHDTLPDQTSNSYPLIDENNVGICLIVNESDYSPESGYKVRRGSDIDCRRLISSMKGMKIKPYLLQDLQSYEICSSIKRGVSDHFISGVHSVLFLVIMAHGDKDLIKGIDGDSVYFDKINDVLSNKSLPVLKGVPKVLIYQTCRGDNHKAVRAVYETDGCDVEYDAPVIKDSMDHYVRCYPCTPDFKAYRHPEEGSPYIHILCKTLLNLYKITEVVTILTEVNREFESSQGLRFRLNDNIVTMQPEFTSSLTRKLFFYKQS